MADDEWEQIGGLFRRKPKPKADHSWIGGLALIIFVVVLLARYGH